MAVLKNIKTEQECAFDTADQATEFLAAVEDKDDWKEVVELDEADAPDADDAAPAPRTRKAK